MSCATVAVSHSRMASGDFWLACAAWMSGCQRSVHATHAGNQCRNSDVICAVLLPQTPQNSPSHANLVMKMV